ncbi:preprotein translocase subunit SecD [Halosolutus amylolyticus]|uniref:Protein-export membrane protein SecD n=1 Tax=Halosolutus amylolyticus TaxID=2932267 RepID=A0ABD5PTH0_9EURY|nr:preprotein translocase subunit SecD [Halosolutus amylolyticus]
MNVKDTIVSNWRVLLLLVFVAFALFALFVPGGVFAEQSTADEQAANESVQADDGGLTNLVYGLGLDGGTRISAPVVGVTAENVELTDSADPGTLESDVAAELDVEATDVRVERADDGSYTAEVFVKNVSTDDLAGALDSADSAADHGEVRDGVTQSTRDDTVQAIDSKINEAGLSGGDVSERSGTTPQIVVEVPDRGDDMNEQELRELLTERGVVTVVAYYPENGTQVNETVLERDDFESIGFASYDEQRDQHYVSVTLTDEAASEYQSKMNEYGFTGEGVGQCQIHDRQAGEFDFDHEGDRWCLVTEVDGEPVDAHSMGGDLARGMQDGTFENDPSFRMIVPSQEDAYSLSVNLRAGSLPAPLDFEKGEVFSITPALADDYKIYSLFIGLLSVLTVSGVVYLRYTNARVAAPMILTALSEVVILLGFVALIRMPLDLSHIAGFIAVVGTGVDDLVIIADEVMDEGDVSSRRVFESRFRKAFWVIGAAAATTIIAMSPLAVLSLGDLQGFAIVTILGVLVGVLVTRPAYGDILEHLLTDR